MAQILKPNRNDNRGGNKPKIKYKLLPHSIRLYEVEKSFLRKYILSVRKKFSKTKINENNIKDYEKFIKEL